MNMRSVIPKGSSMGLKGKHGEAEDLSDHNFLMALVRLKQKVALDFQNVSSNLA